MKHILPELPYSKDALAPYISAETLEFHHGKHHRAYVTKLNELIANTEYEQMSLVDIVLKSDGKIFNNAGQAWNHDFYWKSMTPPQRQNQEIDHIPDVLQSAINDSFGSFEELKKKFTEVGVGTFGSGWTWLVQNPQSKKLDVFSTSNAENPLRSGLIPLLTCDVWEHAYYIDYRNDRSKFLQTFWPLANWRFALKNLQDSGGDVGQFSQRMKSGALTEDSSGKQSGNQSKDAKIS